MFKGNCVDKWISNRFKKALDNLSIIGNHITWRIIERDKTDDYFNTLFSD